ncbi:MAG: RnfABCDGE type electron transport complex subunit D [Bacilli bacterium]|nr:RnfABCDGE type electron transport complex subunit D [Bacilli bacterium]
MGPFIKDNNKTSKMMLHLFISLIPILIFTFIKNGVIPYTHGATNVFGMFYPLIFVFISSLSTFVFETVYGLLFLKRNIKDLIKNTYSIFPGLFLGLILPINTPLFFLVIGSFFASIIAKMLFGGFGNNIFNPALVGRLFIITLYAVVIGKSGGYLNSYELDTVTSSTPLTNASTLVGIGTYDSLVKPYGSLWNFFLGTIPGALGETSALLCLLALFYLSFFKVIKWKIPVTYILTVFAITYVIGGMNNLGIWYPLFQIFSGGLLFGAVFMATDPVTSPVTPIGQVLYGMFLGILTVIFRFLTPFPEGVLTSILTMNMFVMILDKIGSLARFNFKITLIPFFIAWALILILSVGISIHYNTDSLTINSDFNIISKDIQGNRGNYTVTQKGYSSTIKANIVIDGGKIESINILEQNDSFFSKILDDDYINRLISSNGSTDTISGATITSSALRNMVKNTLDDYSNSLGVLEDDGFSDGIVQSSDFSIVSKDMLDDGNLSYIVLSKGFSGNLKLQVILTGGVVTSINVLEQNDSYFGKVVDSDYINTVINNQSHIDDVDVISGATFTSNGIKHAIKNILIDYNGGLNE